MIIATPEAMAALGARLAREVRAGDLVLLNGALGAGKTTLTRGLGEALGVRGAVTSPTFVLARTHPRVSEHPHAAAQASSGAESSHGTSHQHSPTADLPPLVHVDAYRLSSAIELDDLDIDFSGSIVVVEWGAGLLDGLTDDWLQIDIARQSGGDPETEIEPREVTLTGHGERWERWVDAAGN
jgi:tRNA threonylcarbamoyladenosine biosynthesis protein TsaE